MPDVGSTTAAPIAPSARLPRRVSPTLPDRPTGPDDSHAPVLELRIHGINNTSPAQMLDLPLDAIEQVSGDVLGSFWRPKASALARLRRRDRGYVPPGFVREGYSWGGLARTSVGSDGTVGKLVRAAARIGWSMLIPFGLVNAAYWSRRLIDHPDDPADPGRGVVGVSRAGASTLRLAGLLLTLLLASTVSTLVLDVVGIQCFADPQRACEKLPTFAGFLASWGVPQRLALLSFVPLLLIGGLWWLAGVTRSHYERARWYAGAAASGSRIADAGRVPDAGRAADAGEPQDAATAIPRWPLLSTPGFWAHTRITQATGRLHLVAVAVMIAVGTAWHVAFGTGESCLSPSAVLTSSCWAQVSAYGPTAGFETAIVVVGVALLLLIAAVVWVRSEDAVDVVPKSRSSLRSDSSLRAVEVVCALFFAVQTVTLTVVTGPAWAVGDASTGRSATRMLGVSAVPAILLALLLGCSLAALTWRYAGGRVPVALGLGVSAGLLSSSVAWWPGSGPWPGLALAALCAGALAVRTLVAAGGVRGQARRYEAWSGCAPGVWLLLAVLFAMVLSSGVTVVVGNVLNGNYPAASLGGLPAHLAPNGMPSAGPVGPQPPRLLLPRPYVWFGGGVLLIVVVLAVLLLLVLLLQRRLDRRVVKNSEVESAVLRARRLARVAHRAERATGLLAVVGGMALGVSLACAQAGWKPDATQPGWSPGHVVAVVLGAGMWTLAVVGVALVGFAAGGSALGNTRPLGIVWDLVCFLPRAGHPFGPPCYAERVVPEMLGRIQEWLDPRDDDEDETAGVTGAKDSADAASTDTGMAATVVPATGTAGAGTAGAATGPHLATSAAASRQVVLSAHSLGTVLASATILAAAGGHAETRDGAQTAVALSQVSLLTYGTQLRAYFGRIFPELLGPQVLGVPPCLAAGLLSPDPWQQERTDRDRPELRLRDDSLRWLLGGRPAAPDSRWLSLWRPTDYIGFPAWGYGPDSQLDWQVEEVDQTGYLLAVLTHGDYPRAASFVPALTQLAARETPAVRR